jgi:hypothetical protein
VCPAQRIENARWNLCVTDTAQSPDLENKKGTVLSYDMVPYLKHLREQLGLIFGPKCANLFSELNYYYDISKCGLSGHCDRERSKVVGVRVGNTMNLQFQWFTEFKPIGPTIEVFLNEGDIYFMSNKTVGGDWKRSSFSTLRHAAGAPKYCFK